MADDHLRKTCDVVTTKRYKDQKHEALRMEWLNSTAIVRVDVHQGTCEMFVSPSGSMRRLHCGRYPKSMYKPRVFPRSRGHFALAMLPHQASYRPAA